MVTGIGIQGDSNNNQWLKTFKLSHGRTNGVFTELSKVMKKNAVTMNTCGQNLIKANLWFTMSQDNHKLVQGILHVKELVTNVIQRVDPA